MLRSLIYRARFILPLLLAGCATATAPIATPLPSPPPSTAPGSLATQHFDIRSEVADPAALGQLLEAQHTLLRDHYGGREPQRRLPFRMLADNSSFNRALAADHQQDAHTAGGFYGHSTSTAYTYPQPSEYFSRHIALHEAAHQFHFLTAAENKPLVAGDWYIEGLAEYFAMHNWDGATLRLGVIPAVTLEDYPAKALKQLTAADWDVEAIISNRRKVERPAGWAIVAFLMQRDAAKAHAYFAALDARKDALKSWTEILGPITPQTRTDLRRWVESHQQPWQSIWIEWQQWGDAIEGHSDVVAITVLKQTPQRLAADMQWVTGSGSAGLIFGYHSPQDFYFAEVLRESHQLRIARHLNKSWVEVKHFPLPPNDHADVARENIELLRRGDEIELRIRDRKITTMKSPGQIGLGVNNCRVRFLVNTD